MKRAALFTAPGLLLVLAPFALGAGASTGRDGKSSFAANCAYCHGTAGHGDGPNAARLKPRPPDLTKSHLDADAIEKIVRDGRRGCPSWKASLPDDEIRAVAAFARSLEH